MTTWKACNIVNSFVYQHRKQTNLLLEAYRSLPWSTTFSLTEECLLCSQLDVFSRTWVLNMCCRNTSRASKSNFQKAVSFLFKTTESTEAVKSEECFLSRLYHSFLAASVTKSGNTISSQVNTRLGNRHPWRKSTSSLNAASQYSPDIPGIIYRRHPKQ